MLIYGSDGGSYSRGGDDGIPRKARPHHGSDTTLNLPSTRSWLKYFPALRAFNVANRESNLWRRVPQHLDRTAKLPLEAMAARFEPKVPVKLDPPKDDPIPLSELAKANGVDGGTCYVAIKGKVYDVTGNKAYQPGGSYHVFAGKDASRALGKSSTKAEDVSADWEDLDENEQKTLDEWIMFFAKRYNVVGVVAKD
ncbi:hypothetical protein P8C59_004092 [Phyllachora maydis]|uniref:Cytochrome b5 heme-binding domain-containing protein n=1 Tax=Phyllachora maydis TaxID=1825666 RepID=A0AAD9I3B4_9PEZI|nr:hypothetical protein P8C59_004092 [Phyllachora maydis]